MGGQVLPEILIRVHWNMARPDRISGKKMNQRCRMSVHKNENVILVLFFLFLPYCPCPAVPLSLHTILAVTILGNITLLSGVLHNPQGERNIVPKCRKI
jgi:hypothetical protein